MEFNSNGEYDARYRGQSFELPVEYDRAPATVNRRFGQAHRARYGYDVPDEEIEIVNARITAYGTVPRGRRRAGRRPTRRRKDRMWPNATFGSEGNSNASPF